MYKVWWTRYLELQLKKGASHSKYISSDFPDIFQRIINEK